MYVLILFPLLALYGLENRNRYLSTIVQLSTTLLIPAFGTNNANIWEHGAAMNLSLISRKMPVTHNQGLLMNHDTSAVFSSSFILIFLSIFISIL